jgi:hypothetical protein
MKEAVTEATQMYATEKKASGRRSVASGTLTSIMSQIEQKYVLEPGTIRPSTIRNRVLRDNHTGTANQRLSPLANVEPLLVEYCIRLSKIGAPLTRNEVRSLAFSMIEGTDYYDDVIDFKAKHHLLKDSDSCSLDEANILGVRWYRGFMQRNCDKLKRGRGRMGDIKRHTFCTLDSFQNMYDCIYDIMVDAGVAQKLTTPVTYDKYGNEKTDPDKTLGRPTRYKILRPDMILFTDVILTKPMTVIPVDNFLHYHQVSAQPVFWEW